MRRDRSSWREGILPFCRLLCLLLALLVAGGIFEPARLASAREADPPDPYADAAAVDLPDGDYLVDVGMEGGTGRAHVESPARMSVVGGRAAVRLAWSSPHYDYMVVAGERYLPVNDEGNSVFVIPVLAFDEGVPMSADTTAMSTPHLIDYRLTFDAASIRRARPAGPALVAALALAGAAAALCVVRAIRAHGA